MTLGRRDRALAVVPASLDPHVGHAPAVLGDPGPRERIDRPRGAKVGDRDVDRLGQREAGDLMDQLEHRRGLEKRADHPAVDRLTGFVSCGRSSNSGFRPGDPDNGDENKVYEFCRRHVGLCYATKGFDHRSEPISVKRIDVKPQGGRPRYGLDLVRLDSDVMKSWVHSRVRWPKDHPGGWHLPGDVSEEYCRQIVNESRLRKPGGGWTWVPRGPRDYLDCEALAYAGARNLAIASKLANAGVTMLIASISLFDNDNEFVSVPDQDKLDPLSWSAPGSRPVRRVFTLRAQHGH